MKICLVTLSHISQTPRIIKEADYLYQHGFDVVLVSCGYVDWMCENDQIILKKKPWKYEYICLKNRWVPRFFFRLYNYIKRGLFKRVLAKITYNCFVAEIGYDIFTKKVLKKINNVRADYYIAHGLNALPVVTRVANKYKAKIGYDAEDFYVGVFRKNELTGVDYLLTKYLEEKYIARCDYISTPSLPIANEIRSIYKIKNCIVINNTFFYSDRKSMDQLTKDRVNSSLSLYWVSQTIGLDRGIQDVIRAAGLLNCPIQIHLRGHLSDHVRYELLSLAKQNSIEQSIYFHKPQHVDELLSRAAEHDIGLALEPGFSPNNSLTASNKLFQYFLAGITVIATDVPGQNGIMQKTPYAGFVYQPGDYPRLALIIQNLANSPELLQKCKDASLKAAEDFWNFESQGNILRNTIMAQYLNPMDQSATSKSSIV